MKEFIISKSESQLIVRISNNSQKNHNNSLIWLITQVHNHRHKWLLVVAAVLATIVHWQSGRKIISDWFKFGQIESQNKRKKSNFCWKPHTMSNFTQPPSILIVSHKLLNLIPQVRHKSSITNRFIRITSNNSQYILRKIHTFTSK